MHIVLVGVNHKTAPVEVRERLAFPTPSRVGDGLLRLKQRPGVLEAAILSTCNRTELYASMSEPSDAQLRGFLSEAFGAGGELDEYVYSMMEESAVLHLMRVAAGLDSMIVGEGQVLGQVRSAMQVAEEFGTLGTVLSCLFRYALQAGKRVRAETQITRGAVSVSSAAVELARDIFGNLEGRSALIVGAGETGELTLKLLVDEGVSSVIVANRTYDRAKELAEKLGADAVNFDKLEDAMVKSDIVISSTAATHAVIRVDQVQRVMHRRHQRPIFIIDIAVPRDVEPEVGRLENVFLYDIDDLQSMVAHNLNVREREVYKAQTIVEQEAEEFMRWRRTLSVAPVLADLQRRFEDIRQAELAKTERRFSHLSERDRELLDLLTKGIVKRILKEPIRQLKDHAETPDGASYLRAVRHLFGLDGVDEGPEHRRPKKSLGGGPSDDGDSDGQVNDGVNQGGVQA